MVIKKLPQIGNPILRKKAKSVKNFQNKRVKQAIKDLTETMRDSNLIGMAVPQLGKNLRIFATEVRKTKYRSPSELSKLTVYINPKILKTSQKTSIDYEGCGSVIKAQLFGPVKRPEKVIVEAYNKRGQKFRREANGLLSRAIQHEYDHLEGILFTDKISDWKKILSFEEYKKYKERKLKMKTILILHGIGGHPGIHWQQWLHDELAKQGYRVIMPALPNPDHPDRKAWLETIQKATRQVDLTDLIIIAHSLGVTSALDFIETLKTPIKALISVSGFSRDYRAELNSYFLKERRVDFEQVKKNIQNCHVLYGDNDPYVPQKILKALANDLGIEPQVFPNGGHLNTNAGYTQFPELLKIIKKETK